MRKDVYPSGECSELADILPGVQGEVSAGGDDHQSMPEMRQELYLSFRRTAMAEILSGVPDRALMLMLQKFFGRFAWIPREAASFSA